MLEEEKVAMSPQHPTEGTERSRSPVAERSDEERRAKLIKWVILIVAVLATINVVLYVLYYFQTGIWQLLVDSGGIALGLMCLALAYWSVRRGKLDTAGYWVLLAVVIGSSAAELAWAGETLYNAIGGLLLIFIVGSIALPQKWGAWLAVGGLYVICIFLVNQFEPVSRYNIIAESTIEVVSLYLSYLIILALVALAAIWQLVRTYQRFDTIRTRLLIAFVAMVLLPSVVIGAGSVVLGYRIGQQQVINQLESVATLKEAEIETWVNSLQTDLVTASTGEQVTQRTIALLQMPDPSKYLGYWLRNHFQQAIEQAGRFEELFLMDLQGRVVLSNDSTQEGKIHRNQTYFREGLGGPYVQPPFYSPSLGRISVVVVRPIVDEQRRVWGVLAGRASLATLNEIMLERAGLGETGETYLVGRNHTLLTESRFGEEGIYVRTQGANAALEIQANGAGLYEDYRDEPVVGVYHWLPKLQVALLAKQDQSEAFRVMYTTLGVTGGVTLIAVLIAVIASLFITQGIATPLANLAETATQIAAGDLEHVAEMEREDEIGALAQAFNSMTAQLRELIGTLEQRVAERTRQLETAAEVSRAASSILDPERLLKQSVDLIANRFNLYYVGLFLVDEAGEWAVLQAATGEAGQQMVVQGHRLKVGGASMVGWCTANAQARIALDVGEEAVRFENPLLPDTRSEMALPLISRGRVIGVLDVQSTEEAAFDKADIAVMQTMADQVANAIENARLFAETQRLAQRERTISQITGKLRAALNLEDVLQTTVQELGQALGASEAVIRLGTETMPLSHQIETEPGDGDVKG